MSHPDEQLSIFDGRDLRDASIRIAEDHANEVKPRWSDTAYEFLLSYIKTKDQFMAEDVRKASYGIVPTPPSNRAWGAIFVRATKSGLIRRIGFKNVKNPLAHCTPATLWQTVR